MKIFSFYISILLALGLASCQKDAMTTFDVEKSYTVTDTALKRKYIDPVENNQIWQLKLEPKDYGDSFLFYFFKKDGKHYISGSSKTNALPQEIAVKYGTNAVSATIDFTELSYFSSVINDLGTDLTRPSDNYYSFVKEIDNGFLLEGKKYGDKLSLKKLNPNDPITKHIMESGIFKDYEFIEKIYNNKPYLGLKIDNEYAQFVVDPYTDKIWVYYDDINNAKDLYELNHDGSKPRVIEVSSYKLSPLGDTIIMNDVKLKDNKVLSGFVWNTDRSALKALINKQATDLQSQNTPFINVFKLINYLSSPVQEDGNFFNKPTQKEKDLKQFFLRLKLSKTFKYTISDISTPNPVLKDWTPKIRTDLMGIVDGLKKKVTDAQDILLTVDFITPIGELSILPGYEFPLHNGSRINFKFDFKSSTQYPARLFYGFNILANKWNTTDFVNFTFDYYGFERPMSDDAKLIANDDYLNPLIKNLWSSYDTLFSNFRNSTFEGTYLPRSNTSEPIRIQIKALRTGATMVFTMN